jgi:lysophospholipase L1-like esterase
MATRISRVRKIVYALIVLFFVVTAADLVARRYAKHPAADAYEEVYVGHPTRIHALKPGMVKLVPMGMFGQYAEQWRRSGARYEVAINPQGYRDRPFGPKTKPRVVALGDSSTFGWDVQGHEAWPKALERLLAQSGRSVEVLNLGVPGYSSHQGRLLLPEVWPLAPDLLIVAYGRNDELDTAFAPTAHGRGRTDAELMPGDHIAAPPPASVSDRVRESSLFQAARQVQSNWRTEPKSSGTQKEKAADRLRRVPVPQYRENLRAIVQAAREQGVGVILVSLGCFFDEYRAVLLEAAREENVVALNTFPLLFSKVNAIRTEPPYAACRDQLTHWLGRETLDSSLNGWLWFSTDFGHPNACGHQVIAEALMTLIED